MKQYLISPIYRIAYNIQKVRESSPSDKYNSVSEREQTFLQNIAIVFFRQWTRLDDNLLPLVSSLPQVS